ncbi:sensor histidine kinase [Soonwooa sp.]|uniref:sensor histidine kinase n=1 Tax=Soonwooa sp. TaxID=1938592 RepID=UPI0026029C44|nr:sensor histidine kinase [Soonwooa sp.]
MTRAQQIFQRLNQIPQTYFHVGFWLLYMVYVLVVNYLNFGKLDVKEILASLLPLILFFYLCLHGFNLLKKNLPKGIFWFVGIFLLLYVIGYFLIVDIFPSIGISVIVSTFSWKAYVAEIIPISVKFFIYALIFFLISSVFKFQIKLVKAEQEKHKNELEIAVLRQKELEMIAEKRQYEYAFLRAQINPHFLYNTLNVLFSQALNYSQDLADNILKLSDLMRYSLGQAEAETSKILAKDEIHHLKLLLDIHKLRFSDDNFIDFEVKGIVDKQLVPPLSFLTLVENAFKYGDLRNPEFPLKIVIEGEKDFVKIEVSNKKRKNITEIASNQIGIANLKQRLDISFEHKYKINLDEGEDFYTCELIIYQN